MKYFDDYANHIIDTEFYAQEREEDFKNKLEILKRELVGIILSYGSIKSKAVYNQMIKECKQRIEDFFSLYRDEAEHDIREQSNNETEFLKSLFETALGVSIADSLSSDITELPFGSTGNLDSFISSAEQALLKALTIPAMNAFIFGTSTSSVKDVFESSTDRVIKQTASSVHSMVSSVQRNTQQLLLLENKEIKYKYISMLDRRTCVACGNNHGKVYDSLKEAPKLPLHERCRCYYLPVKEDMEEPNYSEWLRNQPDSVQYKILGQVRYFMYKSGMNVSEFSSNGRIITLKELFSNK